VIGQTKLCNEELHNLHSLPHFNGMIRSRRIIWVGHVACMEEVRSAYKILVDWDA
jgi:hypothetical protein